MAFSVIYGTDGCIVSLARFAAADIRDVSGLPAPLLAVEPVEGQQVAILDVDPAWEGRPLADIHQAFTVADGADGPYLRARDGKT